MNPERLMAAALAASVALLAAEVRRMGRERDAARHEFESLVGRLAERPNTVLMQAPYSPPVSDEPTYMSDLPYHDEMWDDFASANEALPALDEDDA